MAYALKRNLRPIVLDMYTLSTEIYAKGYHFLIHTPMGA